MTDKPQQILDLETTLSLCLLGNRNYQKRENGIKYCTLDRKHDCPNKEKVRYLKVYSTIIVEYPICKKT